MTVRVLPLILFALLLIVAVMFRLPHDSRVEIFFGDIAIHADISLTPEERTLGLSHRESLCDTCGMLFVFPHDGPHSIWMKDMYFSIDILWLDAGKQVVHLAEDVSPESFPGTFTSPFPARYVLEVPAGFARRFGVSVGSRFVWG